MSVLVKGMEMPKEGEYRMTLYVCSDGQAYIDVESLPVDEDRFEVIPVHTPHGRLIDASAMYDRFVADTHGLDGIYDATDLPDMLADMPTIIPADNDAAMKKERGK